MLDFNFSNFSCVSNSLTNDLGNPFFETYRREEDLIASSEIFPKLQDTDKYFYFMDVSTKTEVTYYNPKTFGSEALIEPYSFNIQWVQKEPLLTNKYKIKSKDMLNVNLTYGCLLSLSRSL